MSGKSQVVIQHGDLLLVDQGNTHTHNGRRVLQRSGSRFFRGVERLRGQAAASDLHQMHRGSTGLTGRF